MVIGSKRITGLPEICYTMVILGLNRLTLPGKISPKTVRMFFLLDFVN
jgi:hypothetical protein